MPLKSTVDGLEISERMFGSLFQAIVLVKYAEGGQKMEKHYPKVHMLEVW